MKLENFEQREAIKYRKGTPVELKQKPGIVYLIEEYDPVMVPPIWLVDDPKPHYPDELNLMSNLFCLLSRRNLQVA
jgi:hypothetical protein